MYSCTPSVPPVHSVLLYTLLLVLLMSPCTRVLLLYLLYIVYYSTLLLVLLMWPCTRVLLLYLLYSMPDTMCPRCRESSVHRSDRLLAAAGVEEFNQLSISVLSLWFLFSSPSSGTPPTTSAPQPSHRESQTTSQGPELLVSRTLSISTAFGRH